MAKASIFSLFGEVFIDNERANKSIDETKGKAEETGKSFGEKFGSIAKTALAVGTAVVGGTTAIVGGLFKMAEANAETGKEIYVASQKASMSAESFTTLKYVFEQSGLSMNELTGSAQKFNKHFAQAVEGNDKAQASYQKLGISLVDASGKAKSSEQVYQETLKALADMGDTTEANAIGNEIFGKSFANLKPVLAQGSEGIDKISESAREMGFVASESGLKMKADFSASIQTMNKLFGRIKGQLVTAIIPFFQKMVDIVIANMPLINDLVARLVPIIQNLLESFVPPLMDVVANILPVLFSLVESLLPPISDLATQLLPVFLKIFQMIVPPLVQVAQKLLPILVDIILALLPLVEPLLNLLMPILDLLIGLLAPITDLITMLLPPLVEVITFLLNTILPPLQQSIEKTARLISDVLGVAFKIIGDYVQYAITFFNNFLSFIINVFTGNWSGAWENVKNIFNNIMQFLKNTFNNVIDGLCNIFPNLSGAIRFVADLVKNYFVDMFTGIKATFENIKNVFTNIIDFVKNVFTGNWAGAWQNIQNIFSNIANGLGNIFKAPINFIIGVLNGFIDGLNKIQIPDWVPGVGGKGINLPHIPKLRVGMEYVPYDEMPALLHKGERVLTRDEARALDEMQRDWEIKEGKKTNHIFNLYITSPEHLSPSETARLTRKAYQIYNLKMGTV